MTGKFESEEYRQNFDLKLSIDNSQRLRGILTAIIILSGFQMILYTFGDREFYGWPLIIIKLMIVIGGAFLLFINQQLLRGKTHYVSHARLIIHFSVTIMIFLAILNTFFAQRISSDISIYIMSLFAMVAGVRMKPSGILWHLLPSYIIFAIGIAIFQKNPVYQFSHIANGLLMNVIAFIIASMLYHYSKQEYKDKQDIDDKNKELKIISERDALTDLYNYRAISNLLEQMIEESSLIKKEIYLGMLDLDGFKIINDCFGHSYGDEVLKNLAHVIKDNVRGEDIVGRYGGDEFILIFKDASEEQVKRIMNRLLEEVRGIKFSDCSLSFSCGIARWRGETKDRLLERADNLMYEVKRTGRNNVLVEIA